MDIDYYHKPYGLNLSWIDEPKTKRGRVDGILVLTEEWRFILTKDFQQYEITVPKSTELDGPSIPWFARWPVVIVPRNDQTEAPGDAHDILYALAGKIPIEGGSQNLVLSRYESDTLFLLGTLKMALPRWRCVLASAALFLTGWLAWVRVSETDIVNRGAPISARLIG